MGNPANKVFCADGARFSGPFIEPDYDLRVTAPFGGAFSDDAPYSTFTHSWDRSRAPLNGGVGGNDPRIYAYRHSIGQPPPGAEANAFKMNVVFFDGHFETQGDLSTSNPQQWLPQGTVLRTTRIWTDTRITYQLPSTITIGE